MKDVSLSIIIPAFNVEDYLSETLKSIASQSMVLDELIVIDDGSTDATLDVAKSFKFSFPYRVVSVKNGGQGVARNIGIKLAKSEYIYFLDSDDLISKSFVGFVKQELYLNGKPDILLFSGESFNDEGYHGDRWSDYKRGFYGYFRDRCEFLNLAYRNRSLFCSPCLYVSKSSIWRNNSLKFGDNFLEDEGVFYPLLFSCTSFVVKNNVVFFRRNRCDSTMTMEPTLKHVNGSRDCIKSSLKLYQRVGLNQVEKKHIRRRIVGQCTSYVKLTDACGLAVSYRWLASIICETRNLQLLLWLILYRSGLADMKTLSKLRMFLRKRLMS